MRGYTMDRTDYLNRRRRIEGQVRGLHRMIEDPRRSAVVGSLSGHGEARDHAKAVMDVSHP